MYKKRIQQRDEVLSMNDDKFQLGIKNAVRTCMNVSDRDRVFIITDEETLHIGNALLQETQAVGADCSLVTLESYGERPLLSLPVDLVTDFFDFKPTVSFYAAASLPGEVKMRMNLQWEIRRICAAEGITVPRHGHMVSITTQLIREGLTADYEEINRITFQVLDLVKNARTIQVTSPKGTNITATFSPDYRWVPCHGLYHQPGDRGNLPEGEVFTCPYTLDGLLVVDVLGDYFSPKYGVLDSPLDIKVKDSLVEEVSGENQALAQELWEYLTSAENGRRAGEFAIGTNTAVTQLSGNLLQDEKIPGIHVAFGNPIGDQTGADWISDVHVDVIPTECTIIVDGRTIMQGGKFLI
jgi:aminopeptidase